MSSSTSDYSNPSPNHRPAAAGASMLRILLILLIAAGVMWWAGVFKPTPRVALVTSGEGPYWDAVLAGAREAARVYDVKLTELRLPSDEARQTEAIRGLVGKGFAGVAVSPLNPIGQAAVLAELANESALVTVDSDSPLSRRLCFVGTDNYYAGHLAAQHVKRILPEGGEVIICVGNFDKDNTQRRRQGVIDELLDRPDDPDRPNDPLDQPLRGEKFTIVATLVDQSDPALATELAVKAMREHPNVKCFVGLLGYSTPALMRALEQSGKLGQVQVVGFDAAPETLAGIEAGHVAGSVLQDQYGFGFHAVRILAENARGDSSGLPVFQRRTLPCELITRENVSSIRSQLAGAAGASAAPATRPG